MSLRFIIAAALIALPLPALAAPDDDTRIADKAERRLVGDDLAVPEAALRFNSARAVDRPVIRDGDGIPDVLDAEQRAGYRKVFAAIREKRWADAEAQLTAMRSGPLHAIARAELYTAAGSPKVELQPLLTLIADSPDLPQAEQLVRMARARGATDITPPSRPAAPGLVRCRAYPRARPLDAQRFGFHRSRAGDPAFREGR